MAYSECFYETVRSTLSTTKIFVNVHDVEIVCLVNQQQQLGKLVNQNKLFN